MSVRHFLRVLIGLALLVSLTGCVYWPSRIETRPRPRPQKEPVPQVTQVRPEALSALRLRIRVVESAQTVEVSSEQPFDAGGQRLAPGSYVFSARELRAPTMVFHVIVKSFKAWEQREADAAVADWRTKGYDASRVTLGPCVRGSRATYDLRVHLVSIGRWKTRAEAEAARKPLEAERIWSWVREAIDEPGGGKVNVTSGGRALTQLTLPVRVKGPSSVSICLGVGRKPALFSGELEFTVAPSGELRVIETQDLENYLKGVVPSEMPALWPAEALKAQAVAARSETLANLVNKHVLEGFDYCNAEHCRMYRGQSSRHPGSDAAVEATRGVVMVEGGRIVPAVFHANCGGWTENNDAVWSSPADPVLRAVSDVRGSKGGGPGDIEEWISHPPAAYCDADSAQFRWTRRFSTTELSERVGKEFNIGTLQRIELGVRGPGGRLREITLVGSRGQTVIQRELRIRQVLGGLPSAAFLVETQNKGGKPSEFIFRGAGTGHGAGLCQNGAKARAKAGQDYAEILKRYFSGTELERLP